MALKFLGKIIYKLLKNYKPEIKKNINVVTNSTISKKAKLNSLFDLYYSAIGDYTYVAQNSKIYYTTIKKYCSIGPNFSSGFGVHPTDKLSTSPMFYSTKKQNGFSLASADKMEETKPIFIGNDVFIGMNVTVLDGVTIGDGAIIGAGAVVSKDIPPYAIAVGSPIKIIRYRFSEEIIEQLLKIKWWEWDEEKVKLVEQYFDDIEGFISNFSGK
jgi:virginiamycin A acetyltransferase